MADSYILFDLAATTYAVPSEEVLHVEMVEEITPVPNAAAFVEGVVFSRGQVVPVVNLRARFGFARRALDVSTRLLIVQAASRRVGLLVDAAREFVTIPAAAIQPPHDTITALSGRYLDGIATLGTRIVLVLALAEVLSFEETSVAAEARDR